ncbi:hypothetical protein J5X98_17865 [Leptothermofonsia sichuanensis E412]|uniref:ATPase, T2SS/T4P/T4SS family n=1 Tax=Leptothermofonsia sichuanensis TaxID=2917832 RepID=UPI001CA5FBF4|nr:hypothetical protein [Leptothermofonsia sichuanensis]QZZ19256.1 hypothetical protein J5X98_17865 [Leptothermofonsia sichuanensis E412]
MVSFSGDQSNLSANKQLEPINGARPKSDWADYLDAEQIFRLIDSILPFEACLYHQILPLGLEGSRLRLGMVNLEDTAALDYVRKILAYMNCSLVPQTIASDIHHAVLSAYLNHTGTQKQPVSPHANSSSQSIAKRIEQKLTQEAAKKAIVASANDEKNLRPNLPDPHSNPTLLVDSPENLNFQDFDGVDSPILLTGEESGTVIAGAVDSGAGNSDAVGLDSADSAAQSEVASSYHNGQQATFILRTEPPPVEAPPESSPGDSLPVLDINARYLSAPADVLAALPPSELLQELLGRVLVAGIGRLYLERQPNNARILWSQNGVLQSVLDELSVETLQGVINELKMLTRLPLLPVQQPKQVEIERLYQRHRLLLRLRVMPGNHGEEATVQVLRGAALKFYQQQQLANLSRDALTIAQELQQKVNEIRVRTRFYPMLTAEQLSVLPALDNVLKSVEQQLEALKKLQLAEVSGEEESQL